MADRDALENAFKMGEAYAASACSWAKFGDGPCPSRAEYLAAALKPPEAEATARDNTRLGRELADMERANPVIAKAARNVDQVTADIIGRRVGSAVPSVRITSPNAYDASKGERPHDPTLEPSESRATAERAAGETCRACGGPIDGSRCDENCHGSGR